MIVKFIIGLFVAMACWFIIRSPEMPSYKLTYFDIPGKAEPIRLLFHYGKIPFVDIRMKREDWATVKPTTPLGQVPVLEIDGEKFPQSTAIARYVASLSGLLGNDARENLAIDVVVNSLEDISHAVTDIRRAKDDATKQEAQKKVTDKLSVTFKKFDADAKKNGGYIALKRITMADILFVNGYESLVNIQGEDVLSAYPNLQQVKKNVLSVETIKEYIKNRPAQQGPFAGKYDLKQDL